MNKALLVLIMAVSVNAVAASPRESIAAKLAPGHHTGIDECAVQFTPRGVSGFTLEVRQEGVGKVSAVFFKDSELKENLSTDQDTTITFVNKERSLTAREATYSIVLSSKQVSVSRKTGEVVETAVCASK